MMNYILINIFFYIIYIAPYVTQIGTLLTDLGATPAEVCYIFDMHT